MRYKELGLYNAKSEELTVTIPELRICTSVLSSNTYNFNVHAISNKMESTESTLDHKLTYLGATGRCKDVPLNSEKSETKETTPSSAWEATMSAMQHETSLKPLETLLETLLKHLKQEDISILLGSWNLSNDNDTRYDDKRTGHYEE